MIDNLTWTLSPYLAAFRGLEAPGNIRGLDRLLAVEASIARLDAPFQDAATVAGWPVAGLRQLNGVREQVSLLQDGIHAVPAVAQIVFQPQLNVRDLYSSVSLSAIAQIGAPLQNAIDDLNRDLNRWQDQWTTRLGPGTLFGDLFAAREGDVEASWRLAGRLMNQWGGGSREANKVLMARAKDQESSRARQKQLALQRAVIHVTQYMTKKVSVRVGNETIRNEDGTVWIVTPGDTHLDWYWWWVQHEAPQAAEAELLGKPYPASRERPRNALGVAEHFTEGWEYTAGPSMIDALNEQMGAIGELQEILAQATDKEREFLDVLYVTDSIAEAERFSGMNEGAGRQMLFRLRNRVRRQA